MSPKRNQSSSGHGGRIKSKRKELGLTQTFVSSYIGVTPPTIGQWEREETTPRGENVIKLGEVLNVSPGWIITGKHTLDAGTPSSMAKEIRLVPMVTMEALHKKFQVRNLNEQATQFRVISGTISSDSFAVQASGDAMLNPHGGPSMPDGTILIVDPTASYGDKSYVIAVSKKAGPLFRKYLVDGPHLWLKALNPDYTKLEFGRGDAVLGVVVKIETDLV
ncbi:MAG: helix-turn-helix domain-containing protein [Gammaproteobacteria bacterium]|nr:helix-turn-helix domain-containing protein [Gammaproteobacteria bacterium]